MIPKQDLYSQVWNAWVDQESKGVRYCVESHLARENLLVEIQIVAAIWEQ